jgi:hypothetical protein
MLVQVIHTGNYHYDYVQDFMLDSLIKSKEIVKFKRSTGWVTVGADPTREGKRDIVFNDNARLAINDSIFIREYRRAYQ